MIHLPEKLEPELKKSPSFLEKHMLQMKKTAPKSLILHNPLVNDKSSQLNYIERFRERIISRDSPPPLSPTSHIPLNPSNVVANLRKRSLSALTNFIGDGDDGAEKLLNHTILCSRQIQRE